MRAFLQAALLVSRDAGQEQRVLDVAEVVDDASASSATYSFGTFTLTPGQSAFAVPFGGVASASVVMVLATDEIQLQVDSNAAPLVPVRPTPAVAQGALSLSQFQQADQPGIVLWRGKVTSLFATNPSSTKAAQFQVALVGEAA